LSVLKKAAAIFLLSIFVFDLVGYFPLYRLVQNEIRREVKHHLENGIPEEDLVHIAVPVSRTADMDWVRKDKEFRLNGMMYDVVRTETTGDLISYYCLNDKQETRLFEGLDKLVQKQQDSDRSPAGKTAKNLGKVFAAFKSVIPAPFTLRPDVSSITTTCSYRCNFVTVYIEVPHLPPNPVV
jgi:hypothetical protein